MRFPNAAKGVKKLFTAEILTLIASLALLATVIIAVVALVDVQNKADVDGGTIAAGLGTIVLLSAAGVIAVIAGILSLVGVIQASKDERSFKTALFAVIIGSVAALAAGIFSKNSLINDVAQTVQNVMSIVVTVYVITGVTKLAEKLDNAEVAKKGKKLLRIIVCIYILSLIASIISLIFGGPFATLTAGILGIVAIVLDVIGYFIYLSLLGKAKKMLEE